MKKMEFVVRLKEAHKASKLSMYRVATDLGISQTTIAKYVKRDRVRVGLLPPVVPLLANYYGKKWQDVVEVVEAEVEAES